MLEKWAEFRFLGRRATVAQLCSELFGSPSGSVSSSFAAASLLLKARKLPPLAETLESITYCQRQWTQNPPLEDWASLSPEDYLRPLFLGCSPATWLRLKQLCHIRQ